MKESNYKEEYIDSLLSKFMEGETTIEEEDTLAAYFRSNSVRTEWEDYKEMFAYFDNGMPEAEKKKEKRKPWIWKPLSVAAAITAILMMVFPPKTSNEKVAITKNIIQVTKHTEPATQEPTEKPAPAKRKQRTAPTIQTSQEDIILSAMEEERRMQIEMAKAENELAERYSEMLIAEYILERRLEGEEPDLPEVESVGGDAYYAPYDNIMTFIMP